MEEQEGSVKRKSRLAVFEHVVENEKKPKKRKLDHRLNSEDSSPSDSELVIDDIETVKKKKNPLIKLTEELLSLYCQWNDCDEMYNSWEKFNAHLIDHVNNKPDTLTCQWKNCDSQEMQSIPLLMQHMSYHSYISKLKNIGQNISQRNKLPSCKESHQCLIPVTPAGYKCEWEYCSCSFCTIFEFLDHMKVHIKNNPKRAKPNEEIVCCWADCNTKYSTQTKLADHVRIHTKEKVVGCPCCGRLFANKTKFCDHRKRQLSSELQSYQCSQCLKLFPTERLLRDHMRSHINHYKCTMCDMTCPKPSILVKHMRFKHVKFKPYKCTECDKTFVERCNLNTHLKTHESENPFKCELCDFKCRSTASLENHCVKKHGTVSLIYECHCCKKHFKRGTYLTKHLTKQHNYHWPSGHSRFRYRKDQDGIYRLQTVRYESLEVTQEMIRSESKQTNAVNQTTTYNLKYDNDGKSGYVLSISENGEQSFTHTDNSKEDENDHSDENYDGSTEQTRNDNVVITIEDLDAKGNILKCEVVQSTVIPEDEIPPYYESVLPVCEHIDTPDINNSINEESTKAFNKLEETILDYEIFKKK